MRNATEKHLIADVYLCTSTSSSSFFAHNSNNKSNSGSSFQDLKQIQQTTIKKKMRWLDGQRECNAVHTHLSPCWSIFIYGQPIGDRTKSIRRLSIDTQKNEKKTGHIPTL